MNIKKYLIGVGVAISATVPIVAVISCGDNSNKNEGVPKQTQQPPKAPSVDTDTPTEMPVEQIVDKPNIKELDGNLVAQLLNAANAENHFLTNNDHKELYEMSNLKMSFEYRVVPSIQDADLKAKFTELLKYLIFDFTFQGHEITVTVTAKPGAQITGAESLRTKTYTVVEDLTPLQELPIDMMLMTKIIGVGATANSFYTKTGTTVALKPLGTKEDATDATIWGHINHTVLPTFTEAERTSFEAAKAHFSFAISKNAGNSFHFKIVPSEGYKLPMELPEFGMDFDFA